MKKSILYALAVTVFAGCVKNDMPVQRPAEAPEKMTDLVVPADFDWMTTRDVECAFSSENLSKVYVSTAAEAEPFAVFMAGADAHPVRLEVPTSVQTLYVSYETETGLSAPEPVALSEGRAVYAVSAKSKDYSGTEESVQIGKKDKVIYMPARSQGWGTLLFEDLWPSLGDFDFNDYAINYKVMLYVDHKNKVDEMLVAVRVNAVGGSLPYDLYLQLTDVPGKKIDEVEREDHKNAPHADLVLLNGSGSKKNNPAVFKFVNIRTNPNKPGGATYVNTEKGYEIAEEDLVEAVFEVEFEESVHVEDLTFRKFDFFIGRESEDGRTEIHTCGYGPTLDGLDDYIATSFGHPNLDRTLVPYRSNNGLVWALNIPASVQHPYEKGSFLEAYPEFATWAQSGGLRAQDWYEHGVGSLLVHP